MSEATLAAINYLATATSSALALIQAAQAVSMLLQKAHAEGREITDDELDSVVVTDDAARAVLEKAIADAKAAGK
jgi:hypothetical protein